MNSTLTPLETPLDERSKHLRRQIVQMLATTKRGHIGAAFSLIEIIRVLYDDILRYDATHPRWKDRDRFILSKGHGCMALYPILQEKGFFPEEELWKFCTPLGILGGHPEYEKVPGVEASTGSLGHGLSIGIGFALNARYEKAAHKVYVVIGDGESDEGSIWEAALCAGKHQLTNLVVLLDYNKQQSYSTTYEVQDLEPVADKWRAFGFGVRDVNGHDVAALTASLKNAPFEPNKPSLLICHTVKGKGVSFVEQNLDWHHKNNPKEDEITRLKEALR